MCWQPSGAAVGSARLGIICSFLCPSTCSQNTRKELELGKRANEASNAPHICISRYQKSFICALFAVSVVRQGATEFALDLEAEVGSCWSLC